MDNSIILGFAPSKDSLTYFDQIPKMVSLLMAAIAKVFSHEESRLSCSLLIDAKQKVFTSIMSI